MKPPASEAASGWREETARFQLFTMRPDAKKLPFAWFPTRNGASIGSFEG